KDSVACINPKEVAGKAEKHFLQGLKPLSFKGFTPGLKPRPPEEKDFSCSLLRRHRRFGNPLHASQKEHVARNAQKQNQRGDGESSGERMGCGNDVAGDDGRRNGGKLPAEVG